MKKLCGILVIAMLVFYACKSNQNQGEGGGADSSAVPTVVNTENAPTDSTKKVTRYSCPMDPEVRADTPGTCPKCGMELQAES